MADNAAQPAISHSLSSDGVFRKGLAAAGCSPNWRFGFSRIKLSFPCNARQDSRQIDSAANHSRWGWRALLMGQRGGR